MYSFVFNGVVMLSISKINLKIVFIYWIENIKTIQQVKRLFLLLLNSFLKKPVDNFFLIFKKILLENYDIMSL